MFFRRCFLFSLFSACSLALLRCYSGRTKASRPSSFAIFSACFRQAFVRDANFASCVESTAGQSIGMFMRTAPGPQVDLLASFSWMSLWPKKGFEAKLPCNLHCYFSACVRSLRKLLQLASQILRRPLCEEFQVGRTHEQEIVQSRGS